MKVHLQSKIKSLHFFLREKIALILQQMFHIEDEPITRRRSYKKKFSPEKDSKRARYLNFNQTTFNGYTELL